MCGIFVSTSNSFSNIKKLEVVDYYLRSRGPDSGRKILIKDKISFLHRRLAIQDESDNGNQPMYSSGGDFIIVYNGEIYNTNELVNYLKDIHDLELKTNCDTEILIEVLSQKGWNL